MLLFFSWYSSPFFNMQQVQKLIIYDINGHLRFDEPDLVRNVAHDSTLNMLYKLNEKCFRKQY